jgi:hypothetical protein
MEGLRGEEGVADLVVANLPHQLLHCYAALKDYASRWWPQPRCPAQVCLLPPAVQRGMTRAPALLRAGQGLGSQQHAQCREPCRCRMHISWPAASVASFPTPTHRTRQCDT